MAKLSRNIISAQQQPLTPSRRWLAESDAPRAQTLAAIDRIIPWPELVSMARPHFARDLAKARGGRPGFGLELLVRCLVISQLWQCSYRGLAGSLADSVSMATFLGTPLARRTPSASRLRGFFTFLSATRPDGEALSLLDLLTARIRAAINDAELAFIPGRIDEPIFKTLTSSPAAQQKAAAMAAENQRLMDEILKRREDAHG